MKAAASPQPETINAAYADGTTTHVISEAVGSPPRKALESIAELLWHSDYAELFRLEAAELEAAYGLISKAEEARLTARQSTYKQRGLERKPADVEAQKKLMLDLKSASAALRQGNQREHTIYCGARSVAALSRGLSFIEWRRQRASKELLDKKTAIQLLTSFLPPSRYLTYISSM